MYELVILLLLIRSPMHGYLIAHIINGMIGPYAKISNGRLYPLLAKMEQDGLIEADEESEHTQRGERNSRRYRMTEAGRWRFRALMMDTTSNPGEYQRIFTHKVIGFSSLKPAERLYLIDHYINYCQAHVLHLTAEAEDMQANSYQQGPDPSVVLEVMKHALDQWRLEVEWAQHLRAQEVARQQQTAQVEQQERQEQQQQRQRQEQNQNQNRNRNRNQN